MPLPDTVEALRRSWPTSEPDVGGEDDLGVVGRSPELSSSKGTCSSGSATAFAGRSAQAAMVSARFLVPTSVETSSAPWAPVPLRGWSQIMTSFGDTHGLLWKHDERRKLVLDVSLGRPSQGQLQRAALDQLRLNLRVHLEGRGNGPRLSGCCGGEDLSLLGGRARVDLPHRDGGWATSGTRCRAGRERRLILARGRAARMTT